MGDVTRKRTIRLILGDQLTHHLASLTDADPERDIILLAEVRTEATYVPHHPKKIILLFSAMRHFAEELRARGFTVRYVTLEDSANTHSIAGEVRRLAAEEGLGRLVVTQCGEWRLHQELLGLEAHLEFEMREDDRFFCRIPEFRAWAAGKQNLVMEFFYRKMRERSGLLMEGKKPIGGQWNYDKDNRKPLPKAAQADIFGSAAMPGPKRFGPDAITREVTALVRRQFQHYGSPEHFHYPVTRAEALEALEHFIRHALPHFGDYQDAMAKGEPFLFHSILSGALNCGLLTPLEVCRAAEAAYQAGHAPLNAVEGFIRQILGWREFVRGLYWLHMPGYAARNALDATRPLPEFYWNAETDMQCMQQTIRMTMDEAYSHHIQRLMVTGNFALLAGLNPVEVCEWYLAVYIDAYEWVELPNTLGMALFADGGIMGTKPYAASGAYIHKMSDFCTSCRYDVKQKTGPDACPFNYLYWDFLMRHETRLADNMRMKLIYSALKKIAPEQRTAMQTEAKGFLKRMDDGERV